MSEFMATDLQLLRLFVKVAEHGNISHAANACGMSQPSVSRALNALERELQAKLFHRTGRGVRLTSMGEHALMRAQAIVSQSDSLVREIRDLASAPHGKVTLALLTAHMRAVVVDLYDEVRQRLPGVTLHMLESFSAQHEDWLLSGRVDMALVTTYRQPRLDEGELLEVSNMMLVGTPGLGRPGQAVRFHELGGVPIVLPAFPNALRIRMEEAAQRLGIKLDIVFEADSIEAQEALVKSGRCYAVWSEITVRQEQHDRHLCVHPIAEPELPRYVVLRTTSHHPLERAAREVAQILRRLIVSR